MTELSKKQSWLDRPIFSGFPALTGEMLIFLLVIILACISRLYDLGVRVMSHDENLHAYFSWLFSQGQGYQHNPMMHGPLQFHLLALTYFLFGASDFTARLPHALSSILTIVLLWKWRRYLGRAGTLVAAGLMLISPYLLYYGRYARNEAFVGLLFVLTLYAILRYFETGKARYLVLLTIATALHFTVKETAFIYTAQALLFLAFYLVNRVTRSPWRSSGIYKAFFIALSIGVFMAVAALGVTIYNRAVIPLDASETAAPILPDRTGIDTTGLIGQLPSVTTFVVLGGLAFLAAAILLIIGYGWNNLRRERAFDMLILLATFVLPQLAAFPVKALGWDPLEYQFTWPGFDLAALWAQGPVRTAVVFFILIALSIVLGLLWDKKRWPMCAAIFWGIYILFFTTFFTNWQGFFTGTVGSLGYWLEQQGVHRGDQPWYYYLLIQIPIYEFLPALGLAVATYFGLRRKSPAPLPAEAAIPLRGPVAAENIPTPDAESPPPPNGQSISEGNFTFPLLLWWSLSSLLAYTLAGEKMPWLTVHITLPMILLTGWALGQIVERLDWSQARTRRGAWVAILLVVFFVSLSGAFVVLLGANPPFQGKTLEQLSATNTFLLALFLALGSAGGLFYLFLQWKKRDIFRITVLVVFGLLAILTGRTALRASFINYDNATEYLAYAHGSSGIQDVMEQIKRISSRVVGEDNLQIAYDANPPRQGVAWSFKWYLRDYPNAFTFETPDDSLRDIPVIILDQNNFGKLEPFIGDNYYRIDYIRMVWPNQDYFGLTWQRISHDLTDPAMREAILQVWLNRDFSAYAQATGKGSLTLPTWKPAQKMQLYIRKDIAAQMWEYGISQGTPTQIDPYAAGNTSLLADLIVGFPGQEYGQFNAPRGIAVAPDGSLFIADSRNHRIQHLDAEGNFLGTFGEVSAGCPYATIPPTDVTLGTLCEPWGVAVSPDGEWVYVADTWNHRIQKFTADGQTVAAWGTPNYDPDNTGPFGLWGPRGITVDSRGRVLVADTGNKRVVIYDSDGNFISQFGGSGMGPGQLEEPVGLAFDGQGNLYVADTWNQRIQVFTPNIDGTAYFPASQWDVAGWNSDSLDNKPYLAVDQLGHVFVTDPEAFRVIEFTLSGEFIHTWGEYGSGAEGFGLPSGIAVDQDGRVWVSDVGNNRLMRFALP